MKKLLLAVLALYLLLAFTGFSWGGQDSMPLSMYADNSINYFPRPVYQWHGHGLELTCWLMPFQRYVNTGTYTSPLQGGRYLYIISSNKCAGVVK